MRLGQTESEILRIEMFSLDGYDDGLWRGKTEVQVPLPTSTKLCGQRRTAKSLWASYYSLVK